MAIGRKLALAAAGTVAARVTRNMARRALHTPAGAPRLPRRARVKRGIGTAMLWAAGTGALLGLADLLAEQGKEARKKD